MLLNNSVKKVFVSGGAGFIGSHIVDALLDDGYEVTAFDNFSNGRREFVEHHKNNPKFRLIEADMTDLDRVVEAVRGHDLVWHLAANTDIIGSHEKPMRDLNDCMIATFNALEAMRRTGVKNILFSSTGAVYGELCLDRLVTEEAGPLLPVSTYGAGKIASEAFISSYCHIYGLRGWMFRFGNVLGARMTHGVIYDFINKLRKNPNELMILGDGTQRKNYFLVQECMDGMAYAFNNIPMTEQKPCDIFNLGTTTTTGVTDIARIVVEEMGLKNTQIKIQGAPKAWPGDQPRVNFKVDKINALGWKTKRTSDESVRIAIRRMLGKSDG